MKKLLSLILALAVVMSLGISAFAADGDGEAGTTAGATHDPVTVKKEYTVKGGDGETIPSETLSFAVEADESNPDTSMITIDPIDTADTLDISIAFPTYTKMGVYKYYVTETAGSVLGVEYDDSTIEVIVTVVNENAGGEGGDVLKVYVAVFTLTDEGEEDKKIGGDEPTSEDAAFTNVYSLGNLTVSKTVTGNLSSNTKEFTITISFTGGTNAGSPITYKIAGGEEQTLEFAADGTATLEVQLKHGDSVEFTNIPAGVSYTVEESSVHTTGDINSDEGYTATYENSDNESTDSGSGSIAAEDEDTVKITNEKKTEIQTGISLDSMPYIFMMALVLGMAAYMVIRKRRFTED